MSDLDVFIISAARHPIPAQALHQVLTDAGVKAGQVQDAVFGGEAPHSLDLREILRDAGLACPTVIVSSGLRAVMFAAQSILAGDVELVVSIAMQGEDASAFLLASSNAVGRWNLLPRARLAARSLAGIESALRAAGIESEDVIITKHGKHDALLMMELLDELEQRSARWGMVVLDELALLIERI
jgi:acetyl-CoA acetyltransferase